MEKFDNTGLGLVKACIERVQKQTSYFGMVLRILVNFSKEDLINFLNGNNDKLVASYTPQRSTLFTGAFACGGIETFDRVELIKKTTEKVYNKNLYFIKALERLVNSSEENLINLLSCKATPDKPKDKILRLLTADENLVISARDGQRYLAKAKNTFQSGIDLDFEKFGLNKTSHETPETTVDIYEVIRRAVYIEMFSEILGGRLTDELDDNCLTQDQIEGFCIEYHPSLSSSNTLFLFKENRQFFVAKVNVFSKKFGLFVRLNKLKSDLSGDHLYDRVVVPRLKSDILVP